jgi:hypothetical protein
VHAKKGLAKIGDFGEALDRQIKRYFPGLGRICSPPLSAGLLFRDLGSENLDVKDQGARSRAGRGCYNLFQGASLTALISVLR